MTAFGLREGDIIADKYVVESVLGSGGMGVVVAARHLKLDERVAIKFLRPETLQHAEAVARFEREARAAVKIKSEHVARVTDVAALASGAPYMVMEYLEGEDLAQWVNQRGALPVELAVDFLLQASEAIAEAHAVGIVHRDLKPANLFCIRRADGLLSIKVLDFGISKFGGPSSAAAEMSMTTTAAVMGSPLYMSPEQMQSARDVDARTDIWALGVILFQLLTGKTPYEAQSVPELAVKIATVAPLPLTSIVPGAPAALEEVISRCLQKDRARRYANVAQLASALQPFASKRGQASADRIARTIEAAGLGTSASSGPGSATRIATDAAPDSWSATSPAPRRGMRRGVIAGSVIVAALALLATVWLVTAPSPEKVAASSASSVPVAPPASPLREESPSPREAPAAARTFEPPSNEGNDDGPAVAAAAPAALPPSRLLGSRSRDQAPGASRGPAATVRIEIANARSGLSVKVDGRPAALPLRLPRDGKSHEVTFETPNFQPEVRRIRADENMSITLDNKPRFYVP